MKKIIALFTMVVFIIFSLSCYSTKNIRLDADSAKDDGKLKISQVVLKSGEIIEFSKNQPGRIHNGSITGTAVKFIGELDKAYIKGIEKNKKGKILRILVSIPLSEVEMIVAKKDDLGKILLGIVGIVAVVALVLAVGTGISSSGWS